MTTRGKQFNAPMTQQEVFIEDAKVVAIMTLPEQVGFRAILIAQRKKEGIELTDDEALLEAKEILKQMIVMAQVVPTRSQAPTRNYKSAKMYKEQFDNELRKILGESASEYNL